MAHPPRARLTPAGSTYLPALMGIRAPLALVVFVGHLSHLGIPTPRAEALTRVPLLSQRTSAIGVFFALSGFVLVLTYTQRLADGTETVGRYFWRRLARLAPLYFFSIAMNVPGGLLAHETWHTLWLQLVGLQSWSHDPDTWFSWNGAAWSLSTEAFFYVAFPLLLQPVLSRMTSARQLVVAWFLLWSVLLEVWVARIPLGHAPLKTLDWWVYVAPPVRLLEFALGGVAAALWRTGAIDRLIQVVGPAAAAVFALLALTVAGPEVHPMLYPTVTVPLVSLTLLWLAQARGPVARFLSSRPLVAAGEHSYAFYLLHVSGLALLGLILAELGQSGSAVAVAPALVAAFLVSAVVAVLSRRFIEVPAQRWLLHRRGARAPSTQRQLDHAVGARGKGHRDGYGDADESPASEASRDQHLQDRVMPEVETVGAPAQPHQGGSGQQPRQEPPRPQDAVEDQRAAGERDQRQAPGEQPPERRVGGSRLAEHLDGVDRDGRQHEQPAEPPETKSGPSALDEEQPARERAADPELVGLGV